MTALSLLGFYKGFTAYLGEGEDIVAIYDRKSRTPFTGLVPAYLAERISAVNGVLASSPEVIAPCVLKDESIFLRGIMPEDFGKLSPLTILEGGMLDLSDVNSMIVGKGLAERLKLKPNEKLLVLGALRDRYLELQVKGIYVSRSAMDDEALAPLYVGQWLRGTDYGHVTLIRFKVDRNTISPNTIYEAVAREASAPSSSAEGQKPYGDSLIPIPQSRFRIEDVGVDEAQMFMKSYLDRYGVTREALLVLSVVVLLLSSASIVIASKTVIAQHRSEIGILRSVGASGKTLRGDILIKLLPWSLLSSALGVLIASATLAFVQGQGYLRVLSHSVPFQLDPLIVAANFILPLVLVSTSVLRADLT